MSKGVFKRLPGKGEIQIALDGKIVLIKEGEEFEGEIELFINQRAYMFVRKVDAPKSVKKEIIKKKPIKQKVVEKEEEIVEKPALSERELYIQDLLDKPNKYWFTMKSKDIKKHLEHLDIDYTGISKKWDLHKHLFEYLNEYK